MSALLLDGAVGQELRRRADPPPESLWPAEALDRDPDLVRQVHIDYLAAGADVVTTNTYATVEARLHALTDLGDRFEELMRIAGRLAVEARDATNPSARIAGSLPPLHGSYRPDAVGAEADLDREYARHVDLLSPYVDLFLCETMSTGAEARAALRAARRSGKPVYVSWTAQDKPAADGTVRLRSGESLEEAYAALDGAPDAAMLNCCWPESISAACSAMAALPAPIWGGHANGFSEIPPGWTVGQGIDALGRRVEITPEKYWEHARGWLQAGAGIVGGCCEIGPEHIARIARGMAEEGYR